MEELIFSGNEWAVFWPVLWRSLLITEALKRFLYTIQEKESPIITALIASTAVMVIAHLKGASWAFAVELSIYVPLLHLVALRFALKFLQKQTGVNVAEVFEGQTYKLTKIVRNVRTGEELEIGINDPTPDEFKTVMAPPKEKK